ncbi:PhzF family phenazine biosynthesis protein [uncultured Roseobacter sp.]|uniref:PhzF family phenazine biosynthesis protein n=1 Tax=uncultured Roseobacter sp. TaxID=114847 RepID=UPI002639C383|nr:PhzF family phenazine biosynthesis protein [uncultured Roseobacter sp.]
MQLSYSVVDVFTDSCFGGNPLAVVWAPEGLASHLMQKIAHEFNLAETIFLLPPRHDECHVRTRIFTPQTELPFAGHPTVGASFILGRAGRAFGRAITSDVLLEQNIGAVHAELLTECDAVVGGIVSSPEPLAIGPDVDPELIARACNLRPDQIKTSRHAPCICTCGNALVFVEVTSEEALSQANPVISEFQQHLPRERAIGVHLYTPSTKEGVDYAVRMFAPMVGITEDPATGASNLSLVGLLTALAPGNTLRTSYRLEQGVQMGRPSQLRGDATKLDGVLSEFRIGGHCVPVAEGTLNIPSSFQ